LTRVPHAGAGGTPLARVMVCDDSAVIRSAVARALESDHGIRVVARVGNGREALEEARRTAIDVVVLDIEMPVMDGLTALPLLLREHPALKVVMASTLTTRGAEVTLRALSLGAADFVAKPSAVQALGEDVFRRELVQKVKGLAAPRRATLAAPPTCRPPPSQPPRLLAVGSSTGGPQALFTLAQGLGARLTVPVVVTQHMPASFIPILAAHIARAGALPCAEAEDRGPLRPGHITVAPGGRHLIVERSPAGLRARLSDDPPVNFCRPAADPMLESAAEACDGRVLVTILTGMGQDGLAGTRRVVDAGGTAVAQDETTSVVWGMPGAVARAGLCHAVLPLPKIAPRLLDLLACVHA
jgi:two-component system, chemotaxis family, protein-glutamate methylesterase/glutaminase